MTIDSIDTLDLCQLFANLGDAVGSQVVAAWAQTTEYGSETPIADSESNPNAFSIEQTDRFLRAFAQVDDDAEAFVGYIGQELGALERARDDAAAAEREQQAARAAAFADVAEPRFNVVRGQDAYPGADEVGPDDYVVVDSRGERDDLPFGTEAEAAQLAAQLNAEERR